MPEPDVQANQAPAVEPNPALNAEAIPPEQPNAASPLAPAEERRSPRGSGTTLLLVALGLLIAAVLVYAAYGPAPQ